MPHGNLLLTFKNFNVVKGRRDAYLVFSSQKLGYGKSGTVCL